MKKPENKINFVTTKVYSSKSGEVVAPVPKEWLGCEAFIDGDPLRPYKVSRVGNKSVVRVSPELVDKIINIALND